MEKSKINIVVIILLLIFICSLTYVTFSQNDMLNIEGVKFMVPAGYHEGKLNDASIKVNLTDGSHTIYISVYNGTNVSKYVNDYVNQQSSKNQTVILSNLTVDGLDVYKSYNENSNATHYWFAKNGKVYSVYNWGGANTRIDSNFFTLIKNV